MKSIDSTGHEPCIVDGEKHGTVWCWAHSLGLTETKKEAEQRKKEEAEQERLRQQYIQEHGPELFGNFLLAGAGAMGAMAVASEPEGMGENGGEEGDDADEATPANKATSPNQMNQQVMRGQAPDSVDRVDAARIPNEKPHIEFKDGNALNKDGTWKHGGRSLTNTEKEWITTNGWTLPKQ